MTEQQVQPKKSQVAGNMAGVGFILMLVGGLLLWRANNLYDGADFAAIGILFFLAGFAVMIGGGFVKLTTRHR